MKSKLLVEGLSDAAGFVGGALLGSWASRLLGPGLFAPGYGNASIGAIVLVGLGGSLGLQLVRKRRNRPNDQTKE